MVKANRLEKDVRVSGLCGDFLEKGEGDTRRKRRRIHGITVTPTDKNKWTVLWDDGRYQDVKCGQLRIEKDARVLGCDNGRKTSAEDAMGAKVSFEPSSVNKEKDEAVVGGTEDGGGDGIEEDDEGNSVNTKSDDDSDGCEMAELEEKDAPNGIFEDDGDGYTVEGQVKNQNGGKGEDENEKGDKHLTYGERVHRQRLQRMELTGEEVEVFFGPKAKKQSVKWTVIDEKVVRLDDNFCTDHKHIGICGYSPDENDYMKLFLLLWPGEWKEQLAKANYIYATSNNIAVKEYVSQGDFLRFIGILCAASVYRWPSSKFFDKKKSDFRTVIPQVEHIKTLMKSKMHKRNFYLMKRVLPFMFADENVKDTDPWWMIREGIEAFNKNLLQFVGA